jgi:hypothetical protein
MCGADGSSSSPSCVSLVWVPVVDTALVKEPGTMRGCFDDVAIHVVRVVTACSAWYCTADSI